MSEPTLTDHLRVRVPQDESGMGADAIASVDISVQAYDPQQALELHQQIENAIRDVAGEDNVDRKEGGLR